MIRVLALAAILLVPAVRGAVVVQLHPRAGGAPTVSTHASGAPIEIVVNDTMRRVNIFAQSPSTEDIGPVTLTGDGSLQIYLIIGTGDQPTYVPSPGARHLLGLDVQRGNIDLVGNIAGDVSGAVSVPRASRMDVGGAVLAPFEQWGVGELWMEVGAVGEAGAITALGGEIRRLGVHGDCLGEVSSQEGINNMQVVGDLRGDVFAMGDQIAWLEVGGTIGTAEDWVVVRSPSHILIRGGTIFADVEAGVGGADGRVRELTTTDGGFTGRVRCTRLDHHQGKNETMRIRGDFTGELTVTHSVRRPLIIDGSITPGSVVLLQAVTRLEETSTDEHWGLVRVGGSVAGVLVIEHLQRNAFFEVLGDVSGAVRVGRWFDPRSFRPKSTIAGRVTGALLFGGDVNFSVAVGGDAPGVIGIEGELGVPMLVNAAGLGGPTAAGSWDVNGVTLTGTPWYPQGVSGELGQGQIARAPFAVHRSASTPAQGAVLSTAPCPPPPSTCGVVVRFYGPVASGSGGGAGSDFVVQRRQIGSSAWIDVSLQYAADFFYGGDDEVLVFPVGVGSFGPGYHYRIRPRGSVRSEGTAGGNNTTLGAEESVWLEFQVGSQPTGCGLADMTTTGTLNGVPDGAINGSDFTYFLSLFSVGDPRADLTATGSCVPGSGGDGVNGSDFTCFLTLFATGCP